MWDREEIKEDQGEFLNCKSQLYDKLWHNVLHCVLRKHKIKDYTLCHSFESCVCISMLITKLSLCISIDSVLQYCSYSMVCPQTTRNESSKKKEKEKKRVSLVHGIISLQSPTPDCPDTGKHTDSPCLQPLNGISRAHKNGRLEEARVTL